MDEVEVQFVSFIINIVINLQGIIVVVTDTHDLGLLFSSSTNHSKN